MRNLFRYKKRLFMTIFGIAGSMGLMLVGYGIQDSITDIVKIQYSQLQHYDGTIIHDEDASAREEQELLDYLAQDEALERYTHIQMTKMTVSNGHSHLSTYVYVPEDLENFSEDVTLKNRVTGEIYELPKEGAVICEKTASLLGLSIGDTITIQRDNENYPVTVSVITENYMGHYIYMTPEVYEETFGEKPEFVDTVFTVKDEYKDSIEEVGSAIMNCAAALSISYTSSLAGQIERMLTTLDLVIVVLIVSAGMLAFVVLYNLNNINITERQRELATLKVLGFYDLEVSSYVYRENIVLTLIGIVAGCFLGIALHRYIITTVEVDAVMFGRNIRPVSFVYCALFTCAFSILVNLFMHRKLKKIDMVESLKSVE
jgi:putative ABC transport system permease protein